MIPLEGLVPLLLGLYLALTGSGVLPASKDPAENERHLRKHRILYKVIGPLLVGLGLIQLFGLLH